MHYILKKSNQKIKKHGENCAIMYKQFWSYFIKRLSLGLVTIFVILLASYALMRLAPGDPSKSSFLGGGAGDSGAGTISGEKSELNGNKIIKEKLHLDKPMIVGFALWLADVCKGDLGTSVAVDKGRPVTELILDRLPVTIRLNIYSILLTYLLSIPLGIFTAIKHDTMADKGITFGLFFLYSLPVLWTALMLQAAFCKGGLMPIFPLKGVTPDIAPGMSTWKIMGVTAMHYVLPVFCLSYASFAGIARFTRSGMLDVIRQEYIRTARAKGVSEHDVIYTHAFRNALIVMITLFAGILPGLVAGSILIEYIFNIPGMGALSMMALSSRDIPLMMALFAFSGILTLGGILVSDILYVIADPRIGFESRA